MKKFSANEVESVVCFCEDLEHPTHNIAPSIVDYCTGQKFALNSVIGDGNCMFTSVIYALGLTMTVKEFKQMLQKSPALDLVCNRREIDRVLARDRVHGGMDTLYLISMHYNIDICVHQYAVPYGVDPVRNPLLLKFLSYYRVRSENTKLRSHVIHLRYLMQEDEALAGDYDWYAIVRVIRR